MKLRWLAAMVMALACAGCICIGEPTFASFQLGGRDNATGPRILAVIAHPDDETAFSCTLFKTSTFLDGVCDVVVITNGEGGFKYSSAAEPLYRLELTDAAVGRKNLPDVRRGEMFFAAIVLQLHEVSFLEQKDHRYTLDANEVLGPDAHVWDIALVRKRLDEVLTKGRYDFVLVLAPTADTHAHHKAATILALEAVQALPEEKRPIVLAARVAEGESKPVATLPEFPITALAEPAQPLVFDRLQKFGYQDKLDYRIVANWDIAVHFSQGTMQLAMNQGEREEFFLFANDPPDSREKAERLFERLRERQFPSKTYAESAGVQR